MINFNLAGDALVHCLKVSGAKAVLVDEEEEMRTRIGDQRQTLEELGMQETVLSSQLKNYIASKSVQRYDDSYREGLKGSFPSLLLFTR